MNTPSPQKQSGGQEQCPSENCGMCSGEYCAIHGFNCDCDVIDRHGIKLTNPKPPEPSAGKWSVIYGDKPDDQGMSYAHIHESLVYRFTIMHSARHIVNFYALEIVNSLNNQKE